MRKITLFFLMLLSFTAFAQFPAPYCGPLTFTSNVEPITLVNFAGINNATDATVGTANPAHEDFTAITGNVVAGSSYQITLKGNTDGAYTTRLRVYIDWNQNNLFTEANESYDIGNIVNSTGTDAIQLVGTIAVPSTALGGTTRMRVIKRYSAFGTSCQTGAGYGQAEDYTLAVTIPSCVPPSALITSAITSSGASVAWTAPTTAPASGYDYYVTTSSTLPGAATNPTGSVAAGVTTVALTGLNPATTYYVYSRAKCSTSSFSDWSGTSFTTLCVAVTSFTENFDATAISSFPTCWAKIGTGGLSNLQTTNPNSSPNTLYIYSSSTTNRAVVKTVPVSNLGAGTNRLRFKMRGNFTAGDTLEIGYLTNPTDDTSFVVLGSYVADNLTYTDYTFIPTAGSYSENLAFRHSGTMGYSILIDDVVWEAIPSCLEPSLGQATVTSSTSADLSWTSGGAANAEVVIQLAGSGLPALANDTGVNVSGTSYTANGLNPQTAYEFYVRDECTLDTSFSTWSGPFAFNTTQLPGCATLTYPADNATDVPVGTVIFTWDAPTTGDPAASYDLYGGTALPLTAANLVGNFTTTSASIALDNFNTLFYWLVVPKNIAGDAIGCDGNAFSFTTQAPPGYCLNAPNGQWPTATYTPTTCDGNTVNTVTASGYAGEYSAVTVVAGQSYTFASSVATDFITISADEGATAAVYGTTPVTWTAAASTVVRFYTHVDDQCGAASVSRTRSVVCNVALRNDSFNTTKFKYFPNPVTDVLNLSYDKTISKVEVINLLGQKMMVKLLNSTQDQLDMSTLSAGTYLVKVTSDNEVQTIKVVKE